MSQRKDFLLEIGTEEIPAQFLPPAMDWLKAQFSAAVKEARLEPESIETMYTPQRLVIFATNMLERQEDRTLNIVGPPARIAFDADGNPTKAALGFAKKNGIDPASLTIGDGPKGKAAIAVAYEEGRPAVELLSALLPEMMARQPWPKRMHWADETQTYARPVHWIVCMLGQDVVPFAFAGVQSGSESTGHRFVSKGPLPVQNAGRDGFIAALRERKVILSPQERRDMVRNGVNALAETIGAKPVEDEELIDTVADIVEFPTPALGKIEEQFLSLPRELLISSMREHQKYFYFEDADGALLPYFAVTINKPSGSYNDTIVHGNLRVLRARLSDARFFIEEDGKVPLETYAEGLDRVTFQRDLGSIGDKVRRFAALGHSIAKALPKETTQAIEPHMDRACQLAKADLNSLAVYEFPELQGIMGTYYAKDQKEAPEVCDAIASHWRPRFSDDDPAVDALGAVIGVADKLDTIVGCWSVGIKPTGTKDAFALRRQAIGIINTIAAHGWESLHMPTLIDAAFTGVEDKSKQPREEIVQEVHEFFTARFEQMMVDGAIPRDIVQAVLAVGFKNPVTARSKVEALHAFSGQEVYLSLAAAFKRVGNILAKQAAEYYKAGSPAPSEERFEQDEERSLFAVINTLETEVKEHMAKGRYADALNALAGTKQAVDDFFDSVMVMAEDNDIRMNRMGLLNRLNNLFADLADFRKVNVKN